MKKFDHDEVIRYINKIDRAFEGEFQYDFYTVCQTQDANISFFAMIDMVKRALIEVISTYGPEERTVLSEGHFYYSYTGGGCISFTPPLVDELIGKEVFTDQLKFTLTSINVCAEEPNANFYRESITIKVDTYKR